MPEQEKKEQAPGLFDIIGEGIALAREDALGEGVSDERIRNWTRRMVDWGDHKGIYGQRESKFLRDVLDDPSRLENLSMDDLNEAAPFLNRGLSRLLATPAQVGNEFMSTLGLAERDPHQGARIIEEGFRRVGIPVPEPKQKPQNVLELGAQVAAPFVSTGPALLAKGLSRSLPISNFLVNRLFEGGRAERIQNRAQDYLGIEQTDTEEVSK
ncbi:hypothetical protein ACFOW6_17760 [Fodinicurvata halophila]|uniref:DUF937 domain-containing protein n=1 Tax=Fodinicurvata halophila TaxID=1419723 RepID=A0ABV8UQ20_9PROT